MTFARLLILSLVVVSLARRAGAMPAAASSASVEASRRHAVYVELLGKGGLWGFGYDYQWARRLAAGAAISLSIDQAQRSLTASPYFGVYPLVRGRHRWFVHAGPQLVRTVTPSTVPEWPGTSATQLGAELSSGYERRGPLLVRVYGMVAVGSGGVVPWLGLSVGHAF